MSKILNAVKQAERERNRTNGGSHTAPAATPQSVGAMRSQSLDGLWSPFVSLGRAVERPPLASDRTPEAVVDSSPVAAPRTPVAATRQEAPVADRSWDQLVQAAMAQVGECERETAQQGSLQASLKAQMDTHDELVAQVARQRLQLRQRLDDAVRAADAAEVRRVAAVKKLEALRECQAVSQTLQTASQELLAQTNAVAHLTQTQQQVVQQLAHHQQREHQLQERMEQLRARLSHMRANAGLGQGTGELNNASHAPRPKSSQTLSNQIIEESVDE